MKQYVAFLRGVNIGKHHKVPMIELKKEMEKLGFKNITTHLNSGNVIFETDETDTQELVTKIAQHLENKFQFSIPILVRTARDIKQLINDDPFSSIEVTKDNKLYTTFIKKNNDTVIQTPWFSEDRSLEILRVKNQIILSTIDLSKTKTPIGMKIIEEKFGKDITTRNWNTIVKIFQKLK